MQRIIIPVLRIAWIGDASDTYEITTERRQKGQQVVRLSRDDDDDCDYYYHYYYYHYHLVFIIIYLKQTISQGYIVLQLYCMYSLCYMCCYLHVKYILYV
jgi:hypothetical protein